MATETLTFETWFAEEQKKGLKDIKLAVSTNSASSREVQEELLRIETLLKNGFKSDLPTQSECVSEDVNNIICQHLSKI